VAHIGRTGLVPLAISSWRLFFDLEQPRVLDRHRRLRREGAQIDRALVSPGAAWTRAPAFNEAAARSDARDIRRRVSCAADCGSSQIRSARCSVASHGVGNSDVPSLIAAIVAHP
jgi:hypothetical protein